MRANKAGNPQTCAVRRTRLNGVLRKRLVREHSNRKNPLAIYIADSIRRSASPTNGADRPPTIEPCSHTNGRTVRRIIRLNGPILSSDLEGMKDGEQVTLWIEETPQTEVAIGSLQVTTD
jgi:hypothetical protein